MIRWPFSARLFWGVFLIPLLLGGCDGPPPLKNGAPAPAFVLADLQGRRAAFPQQFRGRPVVVGFWADGRIRSKIRGKANRAIFERMVAEILARPGDS